MKKVEVIVEHAGMNQSAYIYDATILTVGHDMSELAHNMTEDIERSLQANAHPCDVLSGEFDMTF